MPWPVSRTWFPWRTSTFRSAPCAIKSPPPFMPLCKSPACPTVLVRCSRFLRSPAWMPNPSRCRKFSLLTAAASTKTARYAELSVPPDSARCSRIGSQPLALGCVRRYLNRRRKFEEGPTAGSWVGYLAAKVGNLGWVHGEYFTLHGHGKWVYRG